MIQHAVTFQGHHPHFYGTLLETYILYAELAYGVVHEDGEVFYCHPHIPIGPAALIWPVLITLVLRGDNDSHYSIN